MSGTASVLQAAMSQLGVPYSWGGESPFTDFDCSGLVQWAYQQAGINLPRTSQDQYAAVTHITAAQAQPGDLVFSAGSDGTDQAPGHVGIYVGNGQYLDAPYTGANVRIDPVPSDAMYGMVAGLQQNAPAGTAQATTADVAPGGSWDPLNWPGQGTQEILGTLGAVDSFFAKVLEPSLWIRIGEGTLGAMLLVVGIVLLVGSSKEGQKAISSATEISGPMAEGVG